MVLDYGLKIVLLKRKNEKKPFQNPADKYKHGKTDVQVSVLRALPRRPPQSHVHDIILPG